VDNYFGRDDWAEDAPGIKTLEDAIEVRRRILGAYERAEREAMAATADGRQLAPERLAELLTFVIVGGGPTGVEMAGAIAEIARHTLRHEFRYVDPGATRVVLVEGSPQLLNGFPPDLATAAARRLEQLGVEIYTSAIVTEIRDGAVSFRRPSSFSSDHRVGRWREGIAARRSARRSPRPRRPDPGRARSHPPGIPRGVCGRRPGRVHGTVCHARCRASPRSLSSRAELPG